MERLPDAMFIVDVGFEKIAIKEAGKLNIPVAGVVDTNGPLRGVDYVVPGNDDAIRAIQLYTRGAADAILDAKASSVKPGAGEKDDFVEVREGATDEQTEAPAQQ